MGQVWERSAGWLGARHPGLRFIRAVASHFKGLLAGVLALRVANDMLSFAGRLALEQIIGWLENPAQACPWWEPAGLPPRLRGVYYVGVMSALSVLRTLLGVQEQALGITMGSQVSTWARAEIYTKALRQKTHVPAPRIICAIDTPIVYIPGTNSTCKHYIYTMRLQSFRDFVARKSESLLGFPTISRWAQCIFLTA